MKSNSIIFRLTRACSPFAPLLALGVMVAFPLLLHHPKIDEQGILARHSQVASAVERAPWRIKQWNGDDVPVPNAGVEILRPNAILSRQFKNIHGGPSFTVMVIHCSDARDMEGHHPPVCYPANGWIEAARPSSCSVQVNARPMNMRVYEFYRPDDTLGIERKMRVFNCFILPDGQVTTEINAVDQVVKRYETSIQGAAQVIVAGPGDADFQASLDAVSELMSGLSDLLAVLGRRTGDS